MIAIPKKVKVEDRYKEFLRIVTSFSKLELSDREIDILDGLYWISDGAITPAARKQIADNLKITQYNLNNQFMKLRKKKVISKLAGNKLEAIVGKLLPSIESDKPEWIINLKLTS
jgi:hypothetical protein